MNCKTCKAEIHKFEVYSTFYYCHNCHKTYEYKTDKGDDMKKNLKQFKEYLEQVLNHYVDNEQEKEMLAIQDVCMKYFEIFGEE